MLARVDHGVLDAQRGRREAAVGRERVDVEPVLALDRHVDPWLARMEVKVARTEAVAGTGGDRRLVAQDTVLEAEDLERAGVLGRAARGVVAARDHDHRLVSWRREDLVPVDAAI